MVFMDGKGLFPAVRFSMLTITALHRNKSDGPCYDGQIGCDASLLETGTDPDRQVSCMAIAHSNLQSKMKVQSKIFSWIWEQFLSLER